MLLPKCRVYLVQDKEQVVYGMQEDDRRQRESVWSLHTGNQTSPLHRMCVQKEEEGLGMDLWTSGVKKETPLHTSTGSSEGQNGVKWFDIDKKNPLIHKKKKIKSSNGYYGDPYD